MLQEPFCMITSRVLYSYNISTRTFKYICLSILAHPSCEGSQFQCHSDGECIPQAWVCDDEEDCDDGSDEHQQCRKL